jgi:hypothetical protein
MWSGSAWRHIASNLDSIHGNIGDTDWHYIDDADIWSKSNIENNATSALNKATSYTSNQMESTILNALTSTEYDQIQTDSFNIAMTFISLEALVGATITDLTINDSEKNYQLFEPIDINGLGISDSIIDWGYQKYSEYDFVSDVQVYAKITGGSWQLCTRGSSIPGITAGMITTDKQIYLKAIMSKLPEGTYSYDPYSFELNVTIT